MWKRRLLFNLFLCIPLLLTLRSCFLARYLPYHDPTAHLAWRRYTPMVAVANLKSDLIELDRQAFLAGHLTMHVDRQTLHVFNTASTERIASLPMSDPLNNPGAWWYQETGILAFYGLGCALHFTALALNLLPRFTPNAIWLTAFGSVFLMAGAARMYHTLDLFTLHWTMGPALYVPFLHGVVALALALAMWFVVRYDLGGRPAHTYLFYKQHRQYYL